MNKPTATVPGQSSIDFLVKPPTADNNLYSLKDTMKALTMLQSFYLNNILFLSRKYYFCIY